MIIDRFSGRHTTTSHDAVEHFSQAVLEVAAHRPGAGEALARALAADPDHIASYALRGLAAITLGRGELLAAAEAAMVKVDDLIAVRGGTDFEQTLARALRHACHGELLAAADVLETRLADEPCDFLCLKLAHALRFMGGDLAGMLASTGRAVKSWDVERPGAGFVYGCHAFGMEEAGFFAAAEQYGRRAVALEPADAWGLHAVSHVHEMQGRTDEGIVWLEGSRPVWKSCNNFSFHLAWHLSLFHLDAGDSDRVLDLYDAEVRPASTDDFRDVANAASLLWRLRQEGVDVGPRWDELALIARRRTTDTTLLFASLHHMLTLVACGESAAAADLLAALEMRAACGQGDQSEVAGTFGVSLARVIANLGRASSAGSGELERIARSLPRLGGSHAQRDVFVRTLALAAADRGDGRAFRQIMGLRHRLRVDDRFATLARQRLAAAGCEAPAQFVA